MNMTKMNWSQYDPSRKTVGEIYRDCQIYGEKQLIVGDLSYEMRKSLADDLNDSIKTGTIDFSGRPFYIRVYEKWDRQMKKALIRRMYKMVFRPYPEAESLVFKVIPYTNEVFFCWELPEIFEMRNELNNPDLYDEERLDKYRKWGNMQLEIFGFKKNEDGNWIENPMYRGDVLISQHTDRQTTVSLASTI
jgi:hypothetical protein